MSSYLKQNLHVLGAVESMHSMAARFGDVYYLPALDPQMPPQGLAEMFEDIHDSNIEFMDQQYPGFKEIAESFYNANRDSYDDLLCEFISELHQECPFPFLVKIMLCQNVHNIHHDEKGVINGYCGAWNSCSHEWFFAESMEKALEIAIELGHKNLVQHQTVLSKETA